MLFLAIYPLVRFFVVDRWPATIQGGTCSDESSTWHTCESWQDQLNSIDNHPGSCSDLFGCFKVTFSGVKWPPFVWSKGHLEETGYELLWNTWPYTFRFNKQPLPSLCTGQMERQMENLVQTVQTCTATSSQVRRAPQFPGDQSTRANRKRLTSEIGHILKPWKLAWNLKITWYEKEII